MLPFEVLKASPLKFASFAKQRVGYASSLQSIDRKRRHLACLFECRRGSSAPRGLARQYPKIFREDLGLINLQDLAGEPSLRFRYERSAVP